MNATFEEFIEIFDSDGDINKNTDEEELNQIREVLENHPEYVNDGEALLTALRRGCIDIVKLILEYDKSSEDLRMQYNKRTSILIYTEKATTDIRTYNILSDVIEYVINMKPDSKYLRYSHKSDGIYKNLTILLHTINCGFVNVVELIVDKDPDIFLLNDPIFCHWTSTEEYYITYIN